VSGAQVKTIVKKERAEDLGMTADELLQRQGSCFCSNRVLLEIHQDIPFEPQIAFKSSTCVAAAVDLREMFHDAHREAADKKVSHAHLKKVQLHRC
jgi:hypothetical protein